MGNWASLCSDVVPKSVAFERIKDPHEEAEPLRASGIPAITSRLSKSGKYSVAVANHAFDQKWNIAAAESSRECAQSLTFVLCHSRLKRKCAPELLILEPVNLRSVHGPGCGHTGIKH